MMAKVYKKEKTKKTYTCKVCGRKTVRKHGLCFDCDETKAGYSRDVFLKTRCNKCRTVILTKGYNTKYCMNCKPKFARKLEIKYN